MKFEFGVFSGPKTEKIDILRKSTPNSIFLFRPREVVARRSLACHQPWLVITLRHVSGIFMKFEFGVFSGPKTEKINIAFWENRPAQTQFFCFGPGRLVDAVSPGRPTPVSPKRDATRLKHQNCVVWRPQSLKRENHSFFTPYILLFSPVFGRFLAATDRHTH